MHNSIEDRDDIITRYIESHGLRVLNITDDTVTITDFFNSTKGTVVPKNAIAIKEFLGY